MPKGLISLLIGLALAALAHGASAQGIGGKPECFCTDRAGDRHELGDIICLTVGDRSYMAKCVMVQNVPYWRDQNMGCLSSSLQPEQQFTPRPAKLVIFARRG